MRRSALHNEQTAWVRFPVSIAVSGLLWVFLSLPATLGWLAFVLTAEVAALLSRRALLAGTSSSPLPHLASLLAVSSCWVVFACLLWSTGEPIAHLSAVVSLFTVSLYGVTSGYMNSRILAVMVIPPLACTCILLVMHAWTWLPPAAAFVTTLATFGSCGVIAMNGITLNRADRNLRRSHAELVELNAQYAALTREAERRNRARTRLLADVSHDLRTPLSGVTAGAEKLLETDLDSHQRRWVEIVRSSGAALDRLAGDLLDLSAREAGGLTLKPRVIKLDAVLTDIAEQHRDRATAKGLALNLRLPSDVPGPVLMDDVRLQQVIGNLLSNAIKFTEQGSIDLVLGPVREVEGGEQCEITVQDTGPGFGGVPPESLFARFSRGDGSAARPGLGLGLAIARSWAEAMGGDVRAESRERGSAFIVRLPLNKSGLDVSAGAGESPASADAAKTLPATLRVLVADDHDASREILTLILDAFGANVTSVADGHAASAALQASVYNVVILDLHMPGKDGLAVARELRAREAEAAAARTPVILLTATDSAEVEGRSAAAGCDLLLTKPIQPAQLANAVTRLLGA